MFRTVSKQTATRCFIYLLNDLEIVSADALASFLLASALKAGYSTQELINDLKSDRKRNNE